MTVRVFDAYGTEQSWHWLTTNYGDVYHYPAPAGPGWRLVEIHENKDVALLASAMRAPHKGTVFEGVRVVQDEHGFEILREDSPRDITAGGIQAAAVIVVHMRNPDGTPFPNHDVVWWYSSAPACPGCAPVDGLPEGLTERGDVGSTNINGDVGFGMGGGAYYQPPARGPHAVWPKGTKGDVLWGLGMIAFTNHNSFWPVFEWVEEEEPPEPEPPNNEEVLAAIEELANKVTVVGNEVSAVHSQVASIQAMLQRGFDLTPK